ncbi:PKD domain-containing protein [Yeosuana marina]|uniref:PKD domain-containing protein n=1 Tax=Yeosuana marina TaxID=1565536 RepID=UPI001421F315|nr:PKD domain-containing protein [Yeosuana marina]
MKALKYIFSFSLLLSVFCISCTNDDNNLDYLEKVVAPTNVSALFQVTQDNTGLVTITPNATGAVKYNITLGDDTAEPIVVKQGESAEHTYAEGTYTVTIEAVGLTSLKSVVTQDLVVSFKAPENLVVTIENDAAKSKQVNVTTNADFAMSYEVYFGEDGIDDPVTANIGDTVNYTYQEAGTYTIRVVVMGGAIETSEFTEEFEVTAILQPIASAKKPPFRQDSDVISIFSDEYTDIAGTNFFPNWGQSTIYTAFDLNGDAMIQYTNLNYEGIDIGSAVDASTMENLHIDLWVANDMSIDIYPLPSGVVPDDERFVTKQLVANQWNSFDIPLTDFSDQGLPLDNLMQFKFVGTPAGETVFIDNLYFWKEPSSYAPLLFDDFDGNSNINTWVGDGGTGLNTTYSNPHVDANNFSKTVLEYNDSGQQYANVQFLAPSKFDLSGGKSVFSLKIYVPSSSITGSQPNQVSLKLQNSDLGGNSWQTQTEIVKTIVLDEWQVLTFDFGSDPFINLDGGSPDPIDRTDLDKVVIQVNSENNYDSVIAYIDDFNYGTLAPSDTPPIARDGFEGYGTITTWLGDGAGMNTAFANPYVDADNGSATVLEYNDDGGQYANVQFSVTPKFDLMAKSKFTLKIYVPSSSITGTQPNQVSLKLQNTDLGGNSWQTQTEIVKPIVLDQWQELTFDFVNDTFINLDGGSPDPVDRTDLDKVVIQVNSENNTDKVVAYIDDFNYHK